MEVVFLIGRPLFGVVFLVSARGHLTKTATLARYAGARGVPQPTLATRGTGVLKNVALAGAALGFWWVFAHDGRLNPRRTTALRSTGDTRSARRRWTNLEPRRRRP